MMPSISNDSMINFWLTGKDFVFGNAGPVLKIISGRLIKHAASIRETAESAIRSNPYVVSYTPTNGVADAVAGESIATNFRRLKPELIESVLLSNASIRWCMRTEPQSIYRGNKIKLMVSFSNLDALPPGKYPATVMVM